MSRSFRSSFSIIHDHEMCLNRDGSRKFWLYWTIFNVYFSSLFILPSLPNQNFGYTEFSINTELLPLLLLWPWPSTKSHQFWLGPCQCDASVQPKFCSLTDRQTENITPTRFRGGVMIIIMNSSTSTIMFIGISELLFQLFSYFYNPKTMILMWMSFFPQIIELSW